MRYVRQAVKEEVSIAVREQGASISDSVLLAMRSGAVTPVQVTPDPHQVQTQILNLLRQGQLNAAFQQVFKHLQTLTLLFLLIHVAEGSFFVHLHCFVLCGHKIQNSVILLCTVYNTDVVKLDFF